MKVIILAAGEGNRTKRLFPDKPKALIPVEGKPIVEHLLAQYRDFEILLNVRGQDAEKFRHLGVPLLIEKRPLGNAGAIRFFIKELGRHFIATHTDVYSDLDPHKLVGAHKGVCTMAVKDIACPKDFGIITHMGDVVTGFSRQRLVNCGIYVFSKDVAGFIGDGFQDFDRDLFPKLIARRKLHFYRHEGTWQDIGRTEYWNYAQEKSGGS